MEFLIVCAVALIASGLTFFSGFGLGTILMPVLALFFPVPRELSRLWSVSCLFFWVLL